MSAIFPLPDDYFKPLQYTVDEERRWKKLVVDLTHQTLEEEHPFYTSDYENVDTSEWKLFKTKDQLRVYRPRHHADDQEPPSVIAVGTIEGTLEDVIYGIHNTTTRDIRVTRAFLSDSALDSAVLHVFENGTEEDPFHSLAVKWRAVATPAGSLVKNRDGVVLEYMGIKRDAQGRRYAVQISENFDHSVCPPFDPKDVVRADVHVRAIYREVGPYRVGVYFVGSYNMSGRIPRILASWTAASVAIAVGMSVECAEAKKLTALALDNHTMTERHRQQLPRPFEVHLCVICKGSPRTFSGGSMGDCHICSMRVCNKCSSRKYLLSDEAKIKVTCCKQCIVAAKNLVVDPRKPLRLISATAWHNHSVVMESRESLASHRSYQSSLHRSSSQGSPRTSAPVLKSSFTFSSSMSTASASSMSPSHGGLFHGRSFDPIDDIDDYHSSTPPQYELLSASSAALMQHESTKPSPFQRSASAPRGELLMQMQQLRMAAEITYQMTTQQSTLLRGRPAYGVLHDSAP